MWGTNSCFLCKKLGNHQKDCPQSKEPVMGRVFAMTQEHVDPDSAIVTCMIFIANFPANVLIDTRATHSFMSVNFMMKSGILPDKSVLGFSVLLPSGEELKNSSVVRNCKIRMQGLELCADFIVLKMTDFDVIFGMDWLSQHDDTIDCKQRTMSLKFQNVESFVFYVASKRAQSGDKELQRPKLEEVEVVKDFPEVFPDDVEGLPPVSEVEFGIELFPGTKPASKESYRLTPTDMKKMKDQLQE
ncbi:uncharacterized protein [Henckelia pumila]|uniref:uncharacterized protein n=1 Tax=Henckelia pumila TaxID=405737 RepID=UPI003C6DE2D0